MARPGRYSGRARRLVILSLVALLLLLGGVAVLLYGLMFRMPGASFTADPPAPVAAERELARRLEAHVTMLATDIGERHAFEAHAYARAADWIEQQFRELGYDATRQTFQVHHASLGPGGVPSHNIIAQRRGRTRAEEIIVIGAHYDSVRGSPGANDNASGVAAMLELARHFADREPTRTLRFIAFANEESPFYGTQNMGSLRNASASRGAAEDIRGMLSLETIGYYSEVDGSQRYPAPLSAFYPARGNFIGFVANTRSRAFLHQIITDFRDAATIASEGGALPESLPGVGWSDHWAFWRAGYPALMVTDTAPFRYPHYHLRSDTPDKLDYTRMARIVTGLQAVIGRLADQVSADVGGVAR